MSFYKELYEERKAQMLASINDSAYIIQHHMDGSKLITFDNDDAIYLDKDRNVIRLFTRCPILKMIVIMEPTFAYVQKTRGYHNFQSYWIEIFPNTYNIYEWSEDDILLFKLSF